MEPTEIQKVHRKYIPVNLLIRKILWTTRENNHHSQTRLAHEKQTAIRRTGQ